MDPLAQLKDIHLPNDVHQWPVAYGWWVVLALVILLVVFFTIKILKKRKLNAAKKQAIKRLSSDSLTGEQIISIVKWVAIHYFSRQQVANLHGAQLAAFLKNTVPDEKQSLLSDELDNLTNAHYHNGHNEVSLNELRKQALIWINLALPPKKHRLSQNPQEVMQ